jgi:predicted RNA-binding protein YlxR (DUF448 family)
MGRSLANQPHRPVRTCVGCRQEAGKQELIRIVRRAGGGATIDRSGREAGRGAYVHRDAACIETAQKRRALERALHVTIQPDLWSELTA